jgi:DNA-binding XRE family transcriptional regulator
MNDAEKHLTLDEIRLLTRPILKPAQMARRMGISRNTYNKHEKSQDCPRRFILCALAIAHNADTMHKMPEPVTGPVVNDECDATEPDTIES